MGSIRLTVSDKDSLQAQLRKQSWGHSYALPHTLTEMPAVQRRTFGAEHMSHIEWFEQNLQNPGKFINYNSRWRFTVEGTPEFMVSVGSGWGSDTKFYPPKKGEHDVIGKDDAEYELFYKWAMEALKHHIQDHIRNRVVHTITAECCNTSGQLLRVWPDVLNFLPPYMVAQLKDAQKSSPLPQYLPSTVLFWIPHISKWLALAGLLKNVEEDDARSYEITIDYSLMSEYVRNAEAGIDPLGLLS